VKGDVVVLPFPFSDLSQKTNEVVEELVAILRK